MYYVMASEIHIPIPIPIPFLRMVKNNSSRDRVMKLFNPNKQGIGEKSPTFIQNDFQGWVPRSFPFRTFRSFPFKKENIMFFSVLFS